MSVKRRIAFIALTLVALLATALGLASVDRCGAWPQSAPQLMGIGRALGPLKVGAAAVELAPEWPTTVAGYGPLRPTASSATTPLEARACVLEVGGERIALVELDVLFVPARLQLAIAEGFSGRVWVTATHTHSSFGGYSHTLAAQAAALGRFDERIEQRLVSRARQAIEEAQRSLVPATLSVSTTSLEGLTFARSGEGLDTRVTVLRFAADRPIAQWVVASAHPSLVDPHAAALDGDWPAVFAQAQRVRHGLTLVLQGAAGNASIDRSKASQPLDFTSKLSTIVDTATAEPVAGPVSLAWSEVAFALPHPDASRLVPAAFAPAVENALCDDSEHDAMVSVLRLDRVSLLFTTIEPSAAMGAVLEEQSQTQRVVGLTNGYHGYLETNQAARSNTGEARRQYFDADFARVVSDAARLAADATKTP